MYAHAFSAAQGCGGAWFIYKKGKGQALGGCQKENEGEIAPSGACVPRKALCGVLCGSAICGKWTDSVRPPQQLHSQRGEQASPPCAAPLSWLCVSCTVVVDESEAKAVLLSVHGRHASRKMSIPHSTVRYFIIANVGNFRGFFLNPDQARSGCSVLSSFIRVHLTARPCA